MGIGHWVLGHFKTQRLRSQPDPGSDPGSWIHIYMYTPTTCTIHVISGWPALYRQNSKRGCRKIAQQEVAKPLPCSVTALGAAEASPRPLHTPPTVTPVCTHVHLYERQSNRIIHTYIHVYTCICGYIMCTLSLKHAGCVENICVLHKK